MMTLPLQGMILASLTKKGSFACETCIIKPYDTPVCFIATISVHLNAKVLASIVFIHVVFEFVQSQDNDDLMAPLMRL